METVLLVATILALLGAYFNSMGKKEGFMIWILTNAVFACNNWMIGQWQQTILFSCYLAIAMNGLYQCQRDGSLES